MNRHQKRSWESSSRLKYRQKWNLEEGLFRVFVTYTHITTKNVSAEMSFSNDLEA